MEQSRPFRFMSDPYLEWSRGEGVPIYEDFGIDLQSVATTWWERFGVDGALVHVKGRGDFMTILLFDIPPGGSSREIRYMFEDVVLVLSGQGNTVMTMASGESCSFEWGPNSVFSHPLNSSHRLFNASGVERARLAVVCNMPLFHNLFRNEQFLFSSTSTFPEREGAHNHFAGEGDFIPVRAGKHMWETNFIPNALDLQLHSWNERGGGSTNIQLILADSTLHAHMSEMPVGTYKKSHRHGSDVHVFPLSGEGYSLFWYEGDKEFVRIDWRHGWVFAPPDMMFHQHFNISGEPCRYIAIGNGSVRYPFTSNMWNVYKGVDVDTKQGGNQIEYQDQDPRVHEIFRRELQARGLKSRMKAFGELG